MEIVGVTEGLAPKVCDGVGESDAEDEKEADAVDVRLTEGEGVADGDGVGDGVRDGVAVDDALSDSRPAQRSKESAAQRMKRRIACACGAGL